MGESTFTRRGAGGGASVIKYTNAGIPFSVYGNPTKINNATNLSFNPNGAGSVSIGNFVLVGGGSSNTINAYNTSLTRSTPTGLSETHSTPQGRSFDNIALFGGGGTNGINSYNTSLTRGTPTVLSRAGTKAVVKVGIGFILFAGGRVNDWSSTVDAYNTSLTRTNPTALSVNLEGLAGSEAGNFGLFAGGRDSNGNRLSTVHAYDTSLTRTIPTSLSTVRAYLGGASVGAFGLFAGGSPTNTPFSATTGVVNAYNTSLTRSNPSQISSRTNLRGSSVSFKGIYAIFAGGGVNGGFGNLDSTSAVNAYNTSLTNVSISWLSTTRDLCFAGVVGDYVLVGGGRNTFNSTNLNTVEVFQIAITGTNYALTTPELSNFNITYKYDFNTIGTGTASEGQTLSSTTTFTGTLEFPENIS
jgi:hypothetical protein